MALEYCKACIPLWCKTICVGSSRWLRPPTPQFRVGDTNMLVSKNASICVTPNANAKICITPNANPQREQVEYRWCCVPNMRGWHWPCRFHIFCVHFICIGYPMRTQFPVEYGLKIFISSILSHSITTIPSDLKQRVFEGKYWV